MTYLYNLPNLSGGADTFIVDMATEIPMLPVMFLTAMWIVIFGGGMLAQAKRSGYVDPPIWSTLAFLICDIGALLMSIQDGLIGPIVLTVLIGGTFFSALWLFLTRGRFEN